MKLHIVENVSLAPLTTLGVGGEAEFFVGVDTVSKLKCAVLWAKEHDCNITILGGGSNVLIPDKGIPGLVIKNTINEITAEEKKDTVTVVAGAGVVFDELVSHTVQNDWWGLENLSAIPGFVGATPIQNVGAYGVEIKDYVAWVEVLDPQDMSIKKINNNDCRFSYRHSLFKTESGKHYIVTRVAFLLSKTPNPILGYQDLEEWFKEHKAVPTIDKVRAAVMRIRSRKFPDWKTVGTAGSFFKNPIVNKIKYEELKEKYPTIPGYETGEGEVKVPLGWVLDRVLNLRGCKEGSVSTYTEQALVLINHGDASAQEIETFAKNIQKKVLEEVGISIEWEVTKLS